MWTLYPPVPGKTPCFSVRGVYCGIKLDKKSTGATEERAARRILDTWKKAAERGEFATAPQAEILTLARAAEGYQAAKGANPYLPKIVAKYGHVPVEQIDQVAIDLWAVALYPENPASTRNRQVYTPVSAVLKHALGENKAIRISRPKGSRGNSSLHFFEPEQAFAVLEQAYAQDAEFGIFCEVALYTGCRLSELLNLTCGDINLDLARAYLRQTKNGKARWVHLTPGCVTALRALPRGLDRGADARVFRFHKGGQFTRQLHAAIDGAGLTAAFPHRARGFHLFCHTYATWQARFNGMTSFELAKTGRWADPSSAERYNHVAPTSHAMKADNLPTRPLLRVVA